MTDAPRYTTLRDYLTVLRRNRLILLVAAILFGVGGWAITAGQSSQYQAQATVSFQDVDLQTSNLLGVTVAPTTDAQARLQINASDITRPAIVRQVASLMRLPVADPYLTANVSAAQNQNAQAFLVITVQSTSPAFAQRLANAYARAVQIEETSLARGQFAAAAVTLEGIARGRAIAGNQIVATTFAQRISDLQFQARTAAPVQIATNAALPTTPVSPHPVRDALLGLLLGLVLGVSIAFGRDALDRRLRGSSQIREELGWPILGHIKENTLGTAGFVTAGGRRLEDADLEGFRILRQNIQFLNVDEPPRSLVVTSARPEEGKSTVAASLACASALAGKRTLLIDCDLRRPSLAKRLGVPAEPGLTDYLLGEAQPADILRTVPLGGSTSANGRSANGGATGPPSSALVPSHVAGAQLVMIPAGRRTDYPSELLGSQRLRHFLTEVCAAYELVVIDTSPVLPVADALELVSETSGTLLCVRASRTTIGELRALKQALERMPIAAAGVVLTGVRSGSEDDFGYYSHRYQYQ